MNLQDKIESWGKDHLDYEAAFFYDIRTEEIASEELTDKGEHSVNILSFLESHDCKNLVCVHNHPPACVGTYLVWKPLSINDLFVNASFNTAGVIANDGINLYSVFKSTDNWGTLLTTPPEDFDRIWIEAVCDLEDEDREKVKTLEMSVGDYYHEREIYRANAVFKKFGISPMVVTPLKNHIQTGFDFDFIPPEDIPSWMQSSPKLIERLTANRGRKF